MALAFVFDENLPGRFASAAARHNLHSPDPIDFIRVGQPPDLPLASKDPDVLAWAERENRILVTEDKHSIPNFHAEHLARGGHSPGVLLVRGGATIPKVIESLVLIAHASEPFEWVDRIEFIP